MLLLQKFDSEIKDKKGRKNSVVDHLSCRHVPSGGDISDTFPDEHLLAISSHVPWNAHIINFILIGSIPKHWNHHQQDKFFHDLKYYFGEEPLLFHLGYDQIIRRCIPEEEQGDILAMCHLSTCERPFAARKTADKNLVERLLLAHYLQGYPSFLYAMPTMSSDIRHLQAR